MKLESQCSKNLDEPESLSLDASYLLCVFDRFREEIQADDHPTSSSYDQVYQGLWTSPRHLLEFDHAEISYLLPESSKDVMVSNSTRYNSDDI